MVKGPSGIICYGNGKGSQWNKYAMVKSLSEIIFYGKGSQWNIESAVDS